MSETRPLSSRKLVAARKQKDSKGGCVRAGAALGGVRCDVWVRPQRTQSPGGERDRMLPGRGVAKSKGAGVAYVGSGERVREGGQVLPEAGVPPVRPRCAAAAAVKPG